jgi:hypothetical protein
MGGIINVILTFLAAVLVYESGHRSVGMLAFILPVIALWAWAMMLRYNPYFIKLRFDRLKSSVRAQNLSKEEYARIEEYMNAALRKIPVMPRWVRIINALLFMSGLGLLGLSGVLILMG